MQIIALHIKECPFDEHNYPKDAKKTNRKAFNRTKNFIDSVFNENSVIKVNYILIKINK